MADEELEGNKSKLPIKLIAIASLIGIVVIVGTVGERLFITGYFDQPDSEEILAAGNESDMAGDEEVEDAGPALLETPNPLDWIRYHRFETPFTANVSQSRMVMQIDQLNDSLRSASNR